MWRWEEVKGQSWVWFLRAFILYFEILSPWDPGLADEAVLTSMCLHTWLSTWVWGDTQSLLFALQPLQCLSVYLVTQ